MRKPWNGWSDYTDRLPDTHIRPIEPRVDLPDWVEGVLVTLIVGIAIVVVLVSILSVPVVR